MVKAAWSVKGRPGQEQELLPRESGLCSWTGLLSGVQELCWEEESAQMKVTRTAAAAVVVSVVVVGKLAAAVVGRQVVVAAVSAVVC